MCLVQVEDNGIEVRIEFMDNFSGRKNKPCALVDSPIRLILLLLSHLPRSDENQ